VSNDEDGRLVSWVLQDVFLLGDLDWKSGAATVDDFLFDMTGRKHALEMTDGIIPKGVIVVTDNGGIRIGLDEA
jgi:hypothetical protein